jgi:hypothetical protein
MAQSIDTLYNCVLPDVEDGEDSDRGMLVTAGFLSWDSVHVLEPVSEAAALNTAPHPLFERKQSGHELSAAETVPPMGLATHCDCPGDSLHIRTCPAHEQYCSCQGLWWECCDDAEDVWIHCTHGCPEASHIRSCPAHGNYCSCQGDWDQCGDNLRGYRNPARTIGHGLSEQFALIRDIGGWPQSYKHLLCTNNLYVSLGLCVLFFKGRR